MLAALAASGEAGVLLPLRFPERAAHPSPVVLVSGRDEHPAILAGIHAAGRRIGDAALGLGPGAVVRGDRNLGQAVAGIREADVDGLALARDVSLVQRSQDADGRV